MCVGLHLHTVGTAVDELEDLARLMLVANVCSLNLHTLPLHNNALRHPERLSFPMYHIASALEITT